MQTKLKSPCGKFWLPVTLEINDDRIVFADSPFELKDEIKAMNGARWHGFEDPPRKVWSIANTQRNVFQLNRLAGKNPYANWDRELEEYDYERPLFPHQHLMANHGLTYHYKILAAEPGTGKTLSAIEIMERSGHDDWWWVAPKSGKDAALEQFDIWNSQVIPKVQTYEELQKTLSRWKGGAAPRGVIFDESSRLKNFKSKRTKAAQALADAIRKEHGWDGFVILMTGTPAPTSPSDWWAQCEVCYPGFLKEGTLKAFEHRLAFMVKEDKKAFGEQGFFYDRIGWRDDSNKCNICSEMKEDHHDMDHDWEESINEVELLYKRMDGLVLPILKKDCLDLPELQFRVVKCDVTPTMKRVASVIADNAPTAIQSLTDLRALSDGFQYRMESKGEKACPECSGSGVSTALQEKCTTCQGQGSVAHEVRVAKRVPCPKDEKLELLLDECSDTGRVVIFAGFEASIDRCVELSHKHKWDACRVDGRGWKVLRHDGNKTTDKVIPHWRDLVANPKVAFIANPMSGGLALTLTEAWMAVFFSNDFNRESRQQAINRIHRMGMGDHAIIVDIEHLPTDAKVRSYLQESRRLELMSLGEIKEALNGR
jgi:hypothetical protein